MSPIPNIPRLQPFTGVSFQITPGGSGGDTVFYNEAGVIYSTFGTVGMNNPKDPLAETGVIYNTFGTIGMNNPKDPLAENGVIYRVIGGIS